MKIQFLDHNNRPIALDQTRCIYHLTKLHNEFKSSVEAEIANHRKSSINRITAEAIWYLGGAQSLIDRGVEEGWMSRELARSVIGKVLEVLQPYKQIIEDDILRNVDVDVDSTHFSKGY